jgi:hypothetical protein
MHSLRFSLTMTAQVSNPYTTTCESILVALYILGYRTERQKIVDRIVTDIFRIHSAFNLFYACYFYFSVHLNFYILEYEIEGRKCWSKLKKAFSKIILLLIPSRLQFYLLVSFPNTLTFPQSKKIYFPSLFCDFVLHCVHETKAVEQLRSLGPGTTNHNALP